MGCVKKADFKFKGDVTGGVLQIKAPKQSVNLGKD